MKMLKFHVLHKASSLKNDSVVDPGTLITVPGNEITWAVSIEADCWHFQVK